MENKCSLKNHLEIKAISYCQECKRYMCNKCDKFHSELFNDEHHQYKLDKDTNEIFTGLCKEKNHLIELAYFCITHNKLCCAKCITKIKNEEDGQHTDFNICSVKDTVVPVLSPLFTINFLKNTKQGTTTGYFQILYKKVKFL